MGKLKDVIERLFHKRSTEINLVMDAIHTDLMANWPEYYPKDVYVEPNGSLTLICVSKGKLYKFPVLQTNNVFTLGDPAEVEVTFTARSATAQIGVLRENGKDYWYIINGVAVLNRDGELDSRKLFDNMIKHANESKQFPFLAFHHCLQPEFKLGETTFLAREGYVYLSIGTWDDSELAQAVKRSVETEPEYWGSSIRFFPLGEPETMVVRSGEAEIKIPVYNDGVHIETSILPEAKAASLFTNTQTMEVTRMNKALEESIRKVFGEAGELADKWIKSIDEVNRTIQEEGMIARGKTETEETPPVETPDPPSSETPPEEPDPTDALVAKVISALEAGGYITKPDMEATAALVRKMADFETTLTDVAQDLTTLAETLEGFAQDEADAKQEREDYSTARTAGNGSRPRERNASKPDDAPLSLDEIAQATIAELETK